MMTMVMMMPMHQIRQDATIDDDENSFGGTQILKRRFGPYTDWTNFNLTIFRLPHHK
jgi:hypothetical protein